MLLPTVGIEQIFNLPYTKEDFKILHHQPINMPSIPHAHKHDFYMILLIEKGNGIHTIDFKAHEVKDKMIFFLAPGQAHQWELSKDTSGYQLMFSLKFLLPGSQRFPYFNLAASPFLPLNDEQYLELVQELAKMEQEVNTMPELYIEILQSRLQVVLLLIKRWYSENFEVQEFTPDHRIIHSFLALLETHYATHSEVSFYANEMSVTANYLNQVCRKKSGITAGDYIRERILLEAKRMLTLTKLDIKEIAYTLGFNDTSYFSRFFRKYTSASPQEFRKMNN
ncbi:helix-turn-helix domain-containing protein [Pedobacter caeni]|uniref:AraC-type DNA-binding protein n=1 Tax=Pedobacter caeni TaxID=288992 RepID=A0A1M4YV04_9SPHI|nr:helix-turn-helix domain-containing protein [Pedobacter caeni]SHF09407.1 AraC-type DNA-binding protein [Pedobacter caeni]